MFCGHCGRRHDLLGTGNEGLSRSKPVSMRLGFDGLATPVRPLFVVEPYAGRISCSAGRPYRRPCHGQPQAPRRRNTRPNAGTRHRQDRDGAAMGVPARHRRWRPSDKPAALSRCSPGRKGERRREHPKAFTGFLWADTYVEFERLYGPDRTLGRITLVACWARARRKFHDVYQADTSLVAVKGAAHDPRYEVERNIVRDLHDDRRKACKLAKLIALDPFAWVDDVLGQLSAHTPLTEPMRYAVRLKPALPAYTPNGRLEIDENVAKNPLRGVAMCGKNWMFDGANCGGERGATMYSLLETAKLNGVRPATLADRCARPDRARSPDQLARRIVAVVLNDTGDDVTG